MAKTEDNVAVSERFIREVLERHFNQRVDSEQLRRAAERLCEAIPNQRGAHGRKAA